MCSTLLHYAISNPVISHTHTQSTPGGNMDWYSPPDLGWVQRAWQIDSCYVSVDMLHYAPWQKWHGDMEMQRSCVRKQHSQLLQEPCRTPWTRTRMDGTIQFDSVFTVRAFGDVLVPPFPLMSHSLLWMKKFKKWRSVWVWYGVCPWFVCPQEKIRLF